ncbi:MAG: penicillin-binding protein 2 [Kiritimatiellae bacterium]|nr:penicillin-binding protein 2 [Kiritimatiellia bacterium]
MTEQRPWWRVGLVVLVFAGVWTGLGMRLAYLHLGENRDLHAKVASIRSFEKDVSVARGKIYDREGNLLALDLRTRHVSVNPTAIQEKGVGRSLAVRLGQILDIPPATIYATTQKPGRKQEYIAKFVHDDKVKAINELGFSEVFYDEISTRYYPQESLMSHILGYVNYEGVGSAGIELKYNKSLRGVPGYRSTQVDGEGREILALRSLDIAPVEGDSIYLTLDQNIQYFTEAALDRAMATNRALGAWAIVQDVKTGEILAMASRPTFNPNQYNQYSDVERRNSTIGYVYEPGSIFKVASIAAILNERLFRPADVIDCENGAWFYSGRVLRDYHAYDRLTVADVLKKSSNIGTAKMALELGEDRLYRYLRGFGFGERTGIELPAEEAGILHGVPSWSSLSLTRVCIGYEVGVTALQMVNMISVFGNHGYRLKPHLIKRIVGSDGMVKYEAQPEVLSRPIRGDTARLMCKLLTRVTEPGGTGRRARFDGYTVAGKTGTAEKIIDGTYSSKHYMASFLGLVPAEDPRIAIIVVVDDPETRTGGVAATPVFREIAENTVKLLDIPPIPEDLTYVFNEEIPDVEQ